MNYQEYVNVMNQTKTLHINGQRIGMYSLNEIGELFRSWYDNNISFEYTETLNNVWINTTISTLN